MTNGVYYYNTTGEIVVITGAKNYSDVNGTMLMCTFERRSGAYSDTAIMQYQFNWFTRVGSL